MSRDIPTVTYVDAAKHPVTGHSARVQVVDHPRFPPGTWVWTSKVLSVVGEKFFTQHTTYIPGVRDRDADYPYRESKRAGDDAKQRIKTK